MKKRSETVVRQISLSFWLRQRDLCLWRHAPTKGTPCPLVCAILYLFPFLIERKPIASRRSSPPASPDCFSFPVKSKTTPFCGVVRFWWSSRDLHPSLNDFRRAFYTLSLSFIPFSQFRQTNPAKRASLKYNRRAATTSLRSFPVLIDARYAPTGLA